MRGSLTRAFGSPLKYIQGPGEINNLPEHILAIGKHPLFVIDRGVREIYYPVIKSIMDKSGIGFSTWCFSGESCKENIESCKAVAYEKACDLVICFGGGKCIDTGKFVSNDMNLPRIVMPTAASSDAPTAGIAVLYSKEGVHISSIKLNHPTELVLIDSKIIANAPSRLFSAGMGDALATYLEALSNVATQGKNFIGKGYHMTRAAAAIAKACYDVLLTEGVSALSAVKEQMVTDAVEDIIEANTLLSGLGFENAGCAAAHGINAGLSEIASAREHLHGEKVAFGIICQLVLENAPVEEIDRIVRFEIEIDLPVSLAQLNIESTEENLSIIVDHVINHNKHIYNEPVIITEESVKNSIVEADRIGRLYLEGQSLIL